jgi:hypothetical protein
MKMFKSGSVRQGWFPVLLLSVAILPSCNDRKAATPAEIAQFKYCSGFTAAAERAAYRRLVDLATIGSLRAQQVEAGQLLLLAPQEMATGIPGPKTDAQGNVPAPAPTEVGRGMMEGQAMIDKNQQKEFLDTVQTCSDLFATIVK